MRKVDFNIREKRLANGLMVLVVERPQHPVVSSMIWYRVGSRDERGAETGVSHFLEHMLFKGTRRLAKGEIDSITARLGGMNNAFTDYDYTAYYFNFARDRWETAFAIEAERMRECLLDEAEFLREKNVVLEEMRMGDDDPWRELAEAVGSAQFHVHPYHHPVIGWKQDVELLTSRRMRDYYNYHYSPDRAVLVVAGDVRASEVFAAASLHFGKLKSTKTVREAVPSEPPQRGERRIQIERDSPVRRLMIAFRGARCGERADHVLDVLGAVLASGHASRLYVNLLKKLRLAVHVSAENEARLDPGVFWLSVEARDGVGCEEIERALRAQILNIKKTLVTTRELNRAKKLIMAGHASTFESASDVADRVGRLEMLFGWRYLNNYKKELDSVTPALVREVANEFLDWRRATIGWSGPAAGEARSSGKLILSKTAASAKSARASRRGRRVVFEPPAEIKKSKFTLPRRRGAPPVVRLDFQREILQNGVTVLATRNTAASTVSFMAYMNIGVACEPEALAGIENLTGSLLEEGSRRFSGEEIAQRIEEEGGFIESGSRGVSATSLADGFPLLLEITADILRAPLFTKEAFDRARDETVSDLIADDDDLRGRAFRRLREMIYGKHPLHRPGDGYVRTVRKLTRAQIVEFYKKWYSPEKLIITVSGDVDPRESVNLIKKHFGSWRATATAAQPSPAPIPAPRAARVVDRVDREQVHIAMGHTGVRRTNPDYYNLLVLDHVLGSGSGFTDRMSKKLRDEEGLAYGVSANITQSAGREPGFFVAYLSTEPKNAQYARESMLRELRKIQTHPPTDAEVRSAKDYLTGSFPFGIERNSSRAWALAQLERHQLGDDYYEKFTSRIENVTTAGVVRAAREYLFPNQCCVVEVGDVKS